MSIKLFLSSCALYILTSGFVLAQTAPETAPANFIIYADGACTMLNEYGEDENFIEADGTEIAANSANGNITLTCSVKLDREVQLKRSKIWNYENTLDKKNKGICFTSVGVTEDWHQIITPSGKAKLTCHIKQ